MLLLVPGQAKNAWEVQCAIRRLKSRPARSKSLSWRETPAGDTIVASSGERLSLSNLILPGYLID
jgi:hypothetical protein